MRTVCLVFIALGTTAWGMLLGCENTNTKPPSGSTGQGGMMNVGGSGTGGVGAETPANSSASTSGNGVGGGAGMGSGGAGGAGGMVSNVDACTPGAAGPNSGTLTPGGAIQAESGKTYSGLQISNPDGPCIVVDGQTNVTIVDSDIGPCGGEAAIILSNGSSNIIIERTEIHDSPRGVLALNSMAVVTSKSRFHDINGVFPQGTAIEYDYMDGGGVIRDNCIEGSYGSDVISGFQSSNLQILHNEVHATITEASAAGFTIGDSVNGSPGHDNYVAYNKVFQSGGVPPGVFGSNGNTVLEHNCLPPGIQAYMYNGPFVGVTVQFNLIGPGYFVPDTSVIAGWDTNTFFDGANCDGL